MNQWTNILRKKMAACGAEAVMLVASWQFGVSGTEVPFSEKEVALEKAIAGSGSGDGICCEVDIISDICKTQVYPVYREYYGKPYFC